MNKDKIIALLAVGVMFIFSAIAILAYDAQPNNVNERLLGNIHAYGEIEMLEEIPTSGNYFVLVSKQEALNRKSEVIGTLYVAEGKNAYGVIRLLIGVKADETINVAFLQLDQTPTYIPQVLDHVNAQYQGIVAVDSLNVDIMAGATAVFSTELVKNMIVAAVKLHFDIEDPVLDSPLLDVFPTFTELVQDDTFVPSEKVSKREFIQDANGDILGYLYTSYGENWYGGEGYEEEGSMVALVAVNLDSTIAMIILPEETYKQSKGSYLIKTTEYAENLAGKDASNYADVDIIGGATQSRSLLKSLVADVLVEHAAQSVDPFAAFFPTYVTREVDADFTPTATLLSREVFKDEADVVLGYRYITYGENWYGGEGYEEAGSMKAIVIVEASSTILSIELPAQDYKQSGGNWRTRTVTYSENLLGKDASNYDDVDIIAGATQSQNLLSDLVRAVIEDLGVN